MVEQEEGRSDRRGKSDIRRLAIEEGVLATSDGSCRFRQGKTSVLVAVSGPVQAKFQHQAHSEQMTIHVQYKQQQNHTSSLDKEVEQVIQQTFAALVLVDKFPRTVLNILVQVVENHGSILAAAINAVNLALLNAGIPMSSFATAMSCAIFDDGGIILDPTSEEEEASAGFVTISTNSSEDGILSSLSSGLMTENQYFACAEACKRGGDCIRSFIRLAQEKRLGLSSLT